MRPCFDTVELLGVYLRRQQEKRAGWVSFRLKGQRTDAQLHALLDQLLPMAQRSSRRIWRERDGHTVTMTIRYRDGVRLADAWRDHAQDKLFLKEQAVLVRAQEIVRMHPTLEQLQQYLAAHVCYENTRQGTVRYGEIVSCITALEEGKANCQGISDAMYLLGTLAGYRMGYQQGYNPQGAHLWNTVMLMEKTYALDATFALSCGDECAVTLDRQACIDRGLRWECWAEEKKITGD